MFLNLETTTCLLQKKVFDLEYGGIPFHLLHNIGIWLGGMVIFCFIRRKCGNYGRLALVARQDPFVEIDDKNMFAWIDRTFSIRYRLFFNTCT